MFNNSAINELWSLKINPSDLYNIERSLNDNPETGGGHTYIQVPRGNVENLLSFLHQDYPRNGSSITLEVGVQQNPEMPLEKIEFWSKSAGRMRIAQQNRHRHNRHSAWSPERGFPSLEPGQDTRDASRILQDIGGLHIYIARCSEGSLWAGFTKGIPSKNENSLPFVDILWGNTTGGYWIYEEKIF